MTTRGPSSKGKRIPPPPADPVQREEVVVERVDTNRPPKAGKKKRKRNRRKVDVSDVTINGVAPATATKLQNRLAEAATAFEAERFGDAEKLLDSIDRLAPGVAEVHELRGLTYYRMSRWGKAIKDLERFNELTNSVEQHPVLADCNRALKRWARAEELWHELGDASPGPELIEEGRIVQAGALADRGRLQDAIRFMEKAPKVKGKPALHHLRRWYVMADLYERAGDNSRSRRLFSDIARAEPDFGDAAERAASL
ncbi:MAG: tetratricopeptide repeat protein [Actinomycetota bacterium]